MTALPDGYNYPINISVSTEPRMFAGVEYKQRSGFAPLRSTRLNYLGLAKTQVDTLISQLDSAGATDKFTWPFRSHYSNKQWLVDTFIVRYHDLNRLHELELPIQEYPTTGAYTPPNEPVLLNVTPTQSFSRSRSYRRKKTGLGHFYDLAREPINAIEDSLEITVVGTHSEIDVIDLILESCRGVYPLIWNSEIHICGSWSMVYQSESAEINIKLDNYYG